jgi:hypothetical protein
MAEGGTHAFAQVYTPDFWKTKVLFAVRFHNRRKMEIHIESAIASLTLSDQQYASAPPSALTSACRCHTRAMSLQHSQSPLP